MSAGRQACHGLLHKKQMMRSMHKALSASMVSHSGAMLQNAMYMRTLMDSHMAEALAPSR